MLTASDIQKRAKMSNADCIITDVKTAMKIDEDFGKDLKTKILIENDKHADEEKEHIETMKSKGKIIVALRTGLFYD